VTGGGRWPRHLVVGVWVVSALLAALLWPALAAAQLLDPYRVAVFTPTPARYTDPRLAEDEEARTSELDYAELRKEIERVLSADVRFAFVGAGELLERDARDPAEAATRQLANNTRASGIEEFGRYELPTAINNLEEALELYASSSAHLTHPRDVAEAHEYLARTFVERAGTGSNEQRIELHNRARAHFREMIRLRPASGIREGVFPGAVVEIYQMAYLELLEDDGAALSLPAERAQALAKRHELERVVWAFSLVEPGQRRLVIEVYDAEGRREARELLPVRETASAVERVNRALSRYLACVPARYPPPPPGSPGDAGRFFLQVGWGAGVYAERPTEGQFANQGIGVTVDHHLSDYLGLFGRANVMFSGRDSEGDLLSRFTSTRLSGGMLLSARLDWLRPFLGLGFELNVVGGFTASDNFWCKVTRGDTRSFGAGRACLPGDVQEQGPRVLLGPALMPGVSFDVLGPFAIYALGSFAFYISDAKTNIDFPVVGEAGIEYRF
jgi:hypothetical protein